MALVDHVPTVRRKPWGIICLVLNILPPGLGTMLAAARQEDTRNFVYGLIQFLGWPLAFIPWVWSIVWGVLIFMKSE